MVQNALRVCAAAAAFACAATLTHHADAIVVDPKWELDPPDEGSWIGRWNGSTAVAVGDHWILTARHVGGTEGQKFRMGGQTYTAVELHRHPIEDLLLIRVEEELPGWHRRAISAQAGDRILLGALGRTSGAFLGDGWDWGGAKREAWGENTIDVAASRIAFMFDHPDSDRALPGEASFALNDSGGGVFTVGRDGELRLAGIASSVAGPWGASIYGVTRSNAVSVLVHNLWISQLIGDHRQATSSMGPVRPLASNSLPPGGAGGGMTFLVPAPGSAALLAAAGAFAASRRKRPQS